MSYSPPHILHMAQDRLIQADASAVTAARAVVVSDCMAARARLSRFLHRLAALGVRFLVLMSAAIASAPPVDKRNSRTAITSPDVSAKVNGVRRQKRSQG